MMICLNSSHSAPFFLIFLSTACFRLSYSIANKTELCPEIEKQSLLNFKKSLQDPHKLLSSWDGEVNCCSWNGVVCNHSTGHVHQLRVQGNYYDYPARIKIEGLSGKLNPSLLNLKHLTHLDLSLNNFTGEPIPSFIGSFAELRYLNLSYAGFHGVIPHDIGKLSKLHTLALQGYQNLEVDTLEWLLGLSKLERLNMNGVDLSKAAGSAQVISTLPSLLELHLSGCHLDSIAVVEWILQLSNLVFLDLSVNSFDGPVPTSSNATNLRHIDLFENYFNSTIPDWLFLCKDLEFVDLSENFFIGTISSTIENLTSLYHLDLGWNQLSGKMPRFAKLCKLQMLDLSGGNLQGDVLDVFGNMSECLSGGLHTLYLRENQISGNLTDVKFGEFKNLVYLDIGFNSLSGNLPESLGQLYNVHKLNIDSNMLEGVVSENHFAKLTKLTQFSASTNHLTLNVSPNWIPPFQLESLELRSWNLVGLGSEAPSWLENQKNIRQLDLSNTGISFNIPTWFWSISLMNLSHNHLHGNVPYLHGTVDSSPQYLFLSSNQFNGSLPRVRGTVRELDLSNNSFSRGMSDFICDTTFQTYDLEILHLGGNQLSGDLPDCWMRWPSLKYLNLGNNIMSGRIPHSIGNLGHLRSLNLYNNKFSGHIPFSLRNCADLVKVDLSYNDLVGGIPAWVGSLIELRILILRFNMLSGNISSEICFLESLKILDLSGNKLSGMIPSCVSNFTAMTTKSMFGEDDWRFDYSRAMRGSLIESVSLQTKGNVWNYDTILPLVTNIDLSKNNLYGDIPKELTHLVELRSLNLSQNQLTGSIPESIGDMKELESLDLSYNSLSGQNPNGLALLHFLSYLNLSYNRLTGRIPESTQISGFSGSSFSGNSLCGLPLTVKCSDEVHEHNEETEDDKPEIEWLYMLLSLGFTLGFSSVCTALALKKPWRDAYFGLLECIWDKVYVFMLVQWIRHSKPSS